MSKKLIQDQSRRETYFFKLKMSPTFQCAWCESIRFGNKTGARPRPPLFNSQFWLSTSVRFGNWKLCFLCALVVRWLNNLAEMVFTGWLRLDWFKLSQAKCVCTQWDHEHTPALDPKWISKVRNHLIFYSWANIIPFARNRLVSFRLLLPIPSCVTLPPGRPNSYSLFPGTGPLVSLN